MEYVYTIADCLFAKPELAVASAKLSYHKVAQIVPNAMLTQCSVVWYDKRKKTVVLPIKTVPIFHTVEHL